MSRKPLILMAAGAFALTATAFAAMASPIGSGANLATAGSQSPVVLVHGGGGHGGSFGGASFHAGGIRTGNFMGHSQFRGQALVRSNFSSMHHFDHGHGHHHHRFFIAAYPYYYYDNGYYDDDYGDDCWWSRRYHRWVCSDY